MYLQEIDIQFFLLIIAFIISAVAILSFLVTFPFIKADTQDLLPTFYIPLHFISQRNANSKTCSMFIPINVCGM